VKEISKKKDEKKKGKTAQSLEPFLFSVLIIFKQKTARHVPRSFFSKWD